MTFPRSRVILVFLVLAAVAPLHAQRIARSHSHTPAPASVTLVGSLQSEAGCPGDWDPACATTHLSYDATDQVWQGVFALPAGAYEYKAALNDSWDENYGYGGQGGANIPLNLAGATSVKFYYSHETHWITSNVNVPIATAVGDFQSELGCGGDWQPDCLRSWLQDPDGDGTYTYTTTVLPVGAYAAKVAINESWAENYGEGGSPGGSNINFIVPFSGAQMDFAYDGSTHVLTIGARVGAHDGTISSADLLHDSRSSANRLPGGAVPKGTPVKVRLRALGGDLTGAQVRVWNDLTNVESYVDMTLAAADAHYDWWEATLTPGSDPTILWYRFIARDGTAVTYYEDDVARDGGSGAPRVATADNSWQITEYDPAFTTPAWAKNGIVYQIFPDRFRDGNAANDTPQGTFFYDEPGGTIRRSGQTNWNQPICDPRAAGACQGKYSDNFYGGDLQGIVDKLSYLHDLGVTVLYLNPIFESPSNHKYDTTDYSVIDDNLGDLALFQSLTSQAHAFGMKVVLDGVFNHTSSDSTYFDRYHRYGSNGACEDTASSFRSLYFFYPTSGTGVCAGNTLYQSWFGYDSLPKLNNTLAATRQLIWDDPNSVSRYWLAQGADGWRLDVGGDIDPGLTNDPSNNYWEGFRSAVHAQKPDAWIVGEEWGLATPWTLGAEWDATMNYQFSSAVLGFWRDDTFTDDDHDAGSSAGVLAPLTPSQLDARLHNLEERYPRESLQAMMNLLDSHDTNRALFMLDHNTGQNDPSIYASPSYDWSDAIARLKGAVLLQMTLPGAPTIYYGDEVGLVGPVAYSGGKWEDDPYNRQPYPWLDEAGTPLYAHLQSGGAGESLRTYYQLLATTRNAHAALRTGTFDTLLTDDANDVYAYGRKLADSTDAAVVMINRSAAGPQTIGVNVAGYLSEGAQFHDVLNGNAAYFVTGGVLTVPNVAARSGALLVLASSLSTPPSAATNLAVASIGPTSVGLTWSAASGASIYDVYQSVLSGGGYTLAGSTAATNYTATGLTTSNRYYFVVVSRNTTTGLTSGPSNEVSAVPEFDLSDGGNTWFNLQWPPAITHTISTTTPTAAIYGDIWINGATDAAGPVPGIRAQVGYGPTGTQPPAGWQWFDMAYNTQVGNNDEFVGTFLPDQTGNFDYAVRYSSDDGAQWWYGDLNGPQRTGTLVNPGHLTVTASGDATSPAAPQGLIATYTGSAEIRLTWSANSEADLAGYELFREPVAGPAGYERIATIAAGTTTYSDFAVTSGASYRYQVKAYDTSFNRSVASNVLQVAAAVRYVDITFHVTVPWFTPAADVVYITGGIDQFGPWNPGLVAATKTGATTWTYTLHVLEGTGFEYRFTRGTWETVERGPDGVFEVGHSWTATYGATGTQSVDVTVENWRDPIVVSHSPAAGATAVATSATIAVVWSQEMLSNNDFAVVSPGGSVAGTFAYDSGARTTTFVPAQPLLEGTMYSVTVSGKTSAGSNVQQVAVSWTFTTACHVTQPTITAGGAVTFCDGGSVTLTSSSSTGNQWYRNGVLLGGATSNQWIADATGSYTVRVTDGCVSAESNAIDVTENAIPPVPTIVAGGPTTFCAGGSVTLTSSNASGNQWYRNGLALSGETTQTLMVTLAGSYTVTTTNSGCASVASAPTTISVNPKPNATIAVASPMYSGANSAASVNVSCTGVTFSWSITGGTITGGNGTPRITFTAGAAGTLTLSVAVTNGLGCTDTKSADVTVQIAPFGAPPHFRASASGSTASLQWAAVQSADHYEIERSPDNSTWTGRGTTADLTFNEGGLAASAAYFYRVRAVKADATLSAFATDVATTVVFSDDPISTCGPPAIKADHFLEVLNAINLARVGLGIGAATFSNPAPAASAMIKADHVVQLRAALQPVLDAIGVVPVYTDATLIAGTTAPKGAHINEVRDLIR